MKALTLKVGAFSFLGQSEKRLAQTLKFSRFSSPLVTIR